jgi:hypothetical protein
LNSNFQYNCSGTVNINGTIHTVSKITVASDAITYQLTNGTFQQVRKFDGEGSATSVYTTLVSTVSITGQSEGILTSSIIPIATGKDIGTSAVKFLNLYLSGTVSANTGTFSGALSCASIDTGQGAFEIGQNLRTTDHVTFKDVTVTGAEGTRTSGTYVALRVPGGTATAGVLVPSTPWGATVSAAESGAPWREIWKYRMKTSGVMNSVLKLRNSNTSYAYGVYAQIYKNGVAYGAQRGTSSNTYVTYSQAITYVAGDVISLRAKGYYSSTAARRCSAVIELEFLVAETGGIPFTPA